MSAEVEQASNESKLAQTWAILDTAAVANTDGKTFGKCCWWVWSSHTADWLLHFSRCRPGRDINAECICNNYCLHVCFAANQWTGGLDCAKAAGSETTEQPCFERYLCLALNARNKSGTCFEFPFISVTECCTLMVLPAFNCVSSSLWREPCTASATRVVNTRSAHVHTHTRVHASRAAAAGRLEMMYPSQMPLTVIPIKKRAGRGSDGNRHRR